MVYKKQPVHCEDIQLAMWKYHARITLEHLAHALQQNTSNTSVVLEEFSRLVSSYYIVVSLVIYCISSISFTGASAKDYTVSS